MGEEKPTKVEAGQRWHDDDETNDAEYGERYYTVLGKDGPVWGDGPSWRISYDDGYESYAPASMILRDTFVGTVPSPSPTPDRGPRHE